MDKEKIKQAVSLFLEGIGEDKDREGLRETPERIAKMCEEIFEGYGSDASEHLNRTFSSEQKGLVVEKDITSSPSLLRENTYRVCAGQESSGDQQTGQDGGDVCETGADPGTAYGSDRGCDHGYSAAEGRDRHGGSRAYVYDDAGSEKAGQ